MAKIQRALLSVFDKTGLIPFAQALAAAGIEMISTGGTAKALREQGIMVSDLSAYTEFPEMMDGRRENPASAESTADCFICGAIRRMKRRRASTTSNRLIWWW